MKKVDEGAELFDEIWLKGTRQLGIIALIKYGGDFA